MLSLLKVYYSAVLVVMLAVTIAAQLTENIFAIPHSVRTDPWFAATLWDAYFGFFSFYLWVCYRERSVVSRIAWLIAILLLGNIAMSIYALAAISRLKKSASIGDLLTGCNSSNTPKE